MSFDPLTTLLWVTSHFQLFRSINPYQQVFIFRKRSALKNSVLLNRERPEHITNHQPLRSSLVKCINQEPRTEFPERESWTHVRIASGFLAEWLERDISLFGNFPCSQWYKGTSLQVPIPKSASIALTMSSPGSFDEKLSGTQPSSP
jgi:hypothetical protein